MVKEVLEVRNSPDGILGLTDDYNCIEGTNTSSLRNFPNDKIVTIENYENQKTKNDVKIMVDGKLMDHNGSLESVHETKTEDVIHDFETHGKGGQSDKACQTKIDIDDVDSIDILGVTQNEESIDMVSFSI